MGNHTKKPDVYQIITDQIMELLDKGVIPWKKPWKGGASGWPKSLASKKQYRGINTFLLAVTAEAMGFDSSYWLTYKQAINLGGYIKKGEKGTMIVFWKPWEIEETDKETGKVEKKTIPMLKYYRVFNLDQAEGIEPDKLPENSGIITDDDMLDFNPIEACDNIVNHMPNKPTIEHSSQARAYYSTDKDLVHMPNRERFNSEPGYYSSLFHELAHSTGHSSRLDRKELTGKAAFGGYSYGTEELTAEMGAAMLSGMAGIEPDTLENSAAYIDGWRKTIKADKKLVVIAAARAQKAADYILGE